MGIFSAIVSGLMFIESVIASKNKKSINPNMVFYALWTFILTLSTFNLYEIIKPSDKAYLLLTLMLVFYFIGNKLYLLTSKKQKQKTNKIQLPAIINKIKPIYFKYINIIIYIFIILIMIFYILDIIVVFEQIQEGIPVWKIRNWCLEPYGSDNPILARRSFIEECLRTIVLTPFNTLLPPLAAYKFFNGKTKKEKYPLFILSLLILVLSSLAGCGGRLGFIYYFMSFALMLFIIVRKDVKAMIIKYRKLLIIGTITTITILLITTVSRVGVDKLFKQIYTYFALSPTLLSIWLERLTDVTHTYGTLSTFGIYSYVVRVFEVLGLDSLIPAFYTTAYTHICNAEIFLHVGYAYQNAFVSPVYYLYIDGGYIFVCLGSLFFGYLVSLLHARFERNINMRSFVMYTLVVYGVFLSFMRLQVVIPAYIISFVLAYFMIYPQKYTETEKEEIINEEI